MPTTSAYPKTAAQLTVPQEGVARLRRDAVSGVDSSTFGQGVRVLPEGLQADIRQLYYVLRTVDDLVDEGPSDEAATALSAVEDWARGGPPEGEEAALLEDLARRHVFYRDSLLEFCAGMRHDLAGTGIADERQLERYCQCAGGSVGVILAGILGAKTGATRSGMAALGRAMQRTNILRDIDDDYAHGRLYIAASTIRRYGFPNPGDREALLRDQIARADRLYDRGMPAIGGLDAGREAMQLAVTLYREILRQIERDGYGAHAGRAEARLRREEELISPVAQT